MPKTNFKTGQIGSPANIPDEKKPATLLTKSLADDMPEVIKKNKERREIATVCKSGVAEIRVAIDKYKGRTVVDLRVWYQPGTGLEYAPSRKGITIDADKLPELVEAISMALSVYNCP